MLLISCRVLWRGRLFSCKNWTLKKEINQQCSVHGRGSACDCGCDCLTDDGNKPTPHCSLRVNPLPPPHIQHSDPDKKTFSAVRSGPSDQELECPNRVQWRQTWTMWRRQHLLRCSTLSLTCQQVRFIRKPSDRTGSLVQERWETKNWTFCSSPERFSITIISSYSFLWHQPSQQEVVQTLRCKQTFFRLYFKNVSWSFLGHKLRTFFNRVLWFELFDHLEKRLFFLKDFMSKVQPGCEGATFLTLHSSLWSEHMRDQAHPSSTPVPR